uniref:protein NLP7-like n=1 Tax=Erigeron canadensis TaxID=72917 RepID=UPI001CB935D6|nr:protein NLP7-like [Erigeron canadensis]
MALCATKQLFVSQFEPQSNSCSDIDVVVPPDPLVIRAKIKSAFSKIDKSCLNGVIQFWEPVKQQRGRRLLTTSGQPFIYGDPVVNYRRYRILSTLYRYNIDDYDKVMSYSTNVVVDANLDCRKGWAPLVDIALGNELTSYIILPVFYPHSSSSCVGVVECFVEPVGFFGIFQDLKQALKSSGLSTFSVQQFPLYKNTPCLKHVTHEISEVLEMVCESHGLAAAQVWISNGNEDHVPSKIYLEGTQNKPFFAARLVGYCADPDVDPPLYSVEGYYDICDTLPLEIGQGLVGKTLQTHTPHFCTNIYEESVMEKIWGKKVSDNLLPAAEFCSCLAICLRSTDTGDDVDYVFEFLWNQRRNYLILLESLFLTLKRCLPSFKFASGSELGDELSVLDVENSTGSGTGFFNILEGNRFSPVPKALEEAWIRVQEDCISSSNVLNSIPLQRKDPKQLERSLNEATKNPTGLQRPNLLKRKLSDMCESQGESKEDNRTTQDVLCVEIEYADGMFKFNLPTLLATVMVFKNQIKELCKLSPGSYKLKYLDEDGEWILMNSDEHVMDCIRSSRSVNGTNIRLRVLPLAQ